MNIKAFVRKECRGSGLARLGALLLPLATLVSCHYNSDYKLPTVYVPNSVAVADVNGDGVADLLVATTADQGGATNPGFANVILGNKSAPGTFHSGTHYATTGNNPSSIAVADLTGTGGLDLVVANFGSGSVSVFMHGAAPGSFQSGVNITTGGHPNQVVIGDLNGDGKADIVVADASADGNAIILFQDAANPGQFHAPVNLGTGTNGAVGVTIADLDGDGTNDVLVATSDSNGNNGLVYVFYQSASSPGTFLPAVTVPAGAEPNAVKVADVNGDGVLDIIVANEGPGTDATGSAGVSVILQDAAHPGTFFAPVTYATQPGSVDVAVGDLDGDGKPDLVVVNLAPSPTGSISVLLQDATHPGTFLTATTYLGFGQPLGVTIADLNNDGHPDIAIADSATALIMLQNPTAPGTFAQPVQVGN